MSIIVKLRNMKENEKDLLLSLLEKAKEEGLLYICGHDDHIYRIDWMDNIDNEIIIKLK